MSSPTDPKSPQSRAQAIVEDVISRRREGEVISDAQVLQQHPDLLGTLEGMLRRAAMLDSLRPTKHPLEQLLSHFEADSELTAGEEADPTGLEDQLTPAPIPVLPISEIRSDQAERARLTCDEAAIDDGAETCRITMDEDEQAGATSAELDPPPPLGTFPAGGSDSEADHRTWNEPASPDDDDGDPPTAKLYQSPGFGQATRYRPSARPPMAVLRLFDDNQTGGELFRLRQTETTIGREMADICIPHDGMVSSRHVRIERLRDEGGWKWMLHDLGSTNGVFVKAKKIRLRDGDQLLIANRVVQFSQSDQSGQQGNAGEARLDEIRNAGTGEWLELTGGDCWIGRDQSLCEPFLADEPMLDQRFARLIRRPDGRWTLWSNQTLNGLWIRVSQISLVGGSMFQLGEQRFSFHTP